MTRLVRDESVRQLQRDATTVATALRYRVYNHQQLDYREFRESLPGDYITIKQKDHHAVIIGHQPPRHHMITGQDTDGNITVTVQTSSSNVAGRRAGALVLVGALSLLAVGVAVGLAFFQVRRFTRPLEQLAGAAARLGSGDARPSGLRYGLPELDQVAEGLDGSARRVSDLLTAEREFASDASHQLRTPLTALSMRLEEMIASADDPEVVRAEGEAALSQTERLADVVSQLLSPGRRVAAGSAALISVDKVVLEQITEWEPAFRRAGRKMVLIGESRLQAYA